LLHVVAGIFGARRFIPGREKESIMSGSVPHFAAGSSCAYRGNRSRLRFLPRAETLEGRCLLSLTPGNPVVAGTPTEFSGVGTANALAALQSFQAATGGADNGATPAPQSGGFRTINWDDVKLDGTDFGGDTTVINAGATVGIPTNRYQERGVSFAQVYAVSGDGFADVNPSAAGLFPAFSANNTFSALNNITVNLTFDQPSSHTTSKISASSQGFGAVFLNVETPSTTSIEYFHGSQSLGKFFVPVGAPGQPEFLGELFASAIVTNVTIKLGTDAVFTFSGAAITALNADAPPTANLAAADDFVYPEPVASADLPSIIGTQGQTFAGVVGRFSDSRLTAVASNYTGIIDWGDGNTSPATFAANAQGGFDVSGTHTFSRGGTLPVSILVQKLDAANDQITLSNLAKVTALPVLPAKLHGHNLIERSNVGFSTPIATFTSVPGAGIEDFSATITWGDGASTPGTIIRRGATFFVMGSHSYAAGGVDIITTTIENAGQTTYAISEKCTVHAPRIVPGRVIVHHAKKEFVANDRLAALVDLIFLR